MSLYAGNTYYDQSKHTPVHTVIMMEIEQYIARELFKNDLTRIFYSSSEFAFRQRLNLLAKTQTSDLQDFQYPFACYTRSTQFELDSRLGVNSALAYGGTNIGMDVELEGGIIITNCRFMQVVGGYNLTLFFNTDTDMQIAYETLLWIKRLTPKQWTCESLEYANARVGIPIVLQIDSVLVDPSRYNEAEWLKQQRIFPIDVQLSIKTMMFDQIAQGTTSTLFKTTEQDAGPSLYISKQVIFDFMTYKGDDPFFSESHIDMIVSGTFDPDPSVAITVSTTGVSDTAATLTWTITLTNADPGYVETAYIILSTDPQNPIDVIASAGSYTLTALTPATNYSVKIMFETTDHTYAVNYATFTTTGTVPIIEGIIGIKF